MAKVRIQARMPERRTEDENGPPHSSRPPAKAKQTGAVGLLIHVLETEQWQPLGMTVLTLCGLLMGRSLDHVEKVFATDLKMRQRLVFFLIRSGTFMSHLAELDFDKANMESLSPASIAFPGNPLAPFLHTEIWFQIGRVYEQT